MSWAVKNIMEAALLAALFVAGTLAQQAGAPPAPPAGRPAMSRDEALQRAATYNTAIQVLETGAPPLPVQAPVQPQAVAPAAPKGKPNKVSTEPLALTRTPPPLPGNVKAALEISDAALNTDPQPQPSSDGHVTYTWGRGVPPVVCALLQLTEIDLEPGEHATEKDVDVGDDEFRISVHKGAERGGEFDYLIVKPTVANIETTLTVGTNRRVYYFRLIARQADHITRVSFAYPEEEARRRQAEQAQAKAKEEEAAHLAALAPDREIRNWQYGIETHGRDAHYMIPLSVGDDGARTYIQLSQEVRKIGLPAFEITGATGPIPANWHWEENRLIVDAVFDRGCLLEGVGKQQQRVCITNEGEAVKTGAGKQEGR